MNWPDREDQRWSPGLFPESTEDQVIGSISPFERSGRIARAANHCAAVMATAAFAAIVILNPDCKRLQILAEFLRILPVFSCIFF